MNAVATCVRKDGAHITYREKMTAARAMKLVRDSRMKSVVIHQGDYLAAERTYDDAYASHKNPRGLFWFVDESAFLESTPCQP